MKVTKRNGNVVLFDDEKIIRSILKANSEVPEEELMPKEETVVVEKRSKGARNTLLAVTLAVTVAAAILLGIALYRLYFVFF